MNHIVILKTILMKAIMMMAFVVLSATIVYAQSNVENEIKDNSAKRVRWLLEGKADSLLTIYDENSITVYRIDEIGLRAINGVRNGMPACKSMSTETIVNDFDNSAILVCKGCFTTAMAGSEMTLNRVYTEVSQRKGKHWKLIVRHAGSVQ